MAPFRGRGRNARGARMSRGGAGGKLARSGIRTRAGYRKFDSQRVKDVESEESEDEILGSEQVEDENEASDDDEEEAVPTTKAYSTLLQSFSQPGARDERKRKRRKIEVVAEMNGFDEDNPSEQDAGVEVDGDETENDDEDVSANIEGIELQDREEMDTADPFEIHFANPDDNELSRRLEAVEAKDWKTEKHQIGGVGSCTVSTPMCSEGAPIRKHTFASTTDLPLKKRLTNSSRSHISSLNAIQQAIAPYLFNYSDILLANRTPQNASDLRTLACLHGLNHILKGRDKILKNNARLAQSGNEDLNFQDQGFTRPKVLILLETRQMCAKYADSITKLFAPEQQENKQRFLSSFSSPIEDRDTMPEDYNELFEGNNDNNFVTALKFTRKTLRFYAPFYTSDIILASPLGLRRIIENEDVKKRDHDFLSSIEMVIVDQADAMYMQNWTNVETVFRHLNLPPTETHGFDISRVRPWYLDGHAKYLRQTIVMSAYLTPDMNKLFNTHMLNVSGKAKFTTAHIDGAIATIGNGVKQTFSRLSSSPSSSPTTDPDERFKYFTSTVLPALLRSPKPADGAKGILIFIPSYYDFLRLRNFFATNTLTQNSSFGAIHEYSDVPSQRRARSHFLSGRHSILLYTQRAHHFFRLRIRGVKRVVIYGVPENATFFEEIVGGFIGTSLEEGRTSVEEASVRVLFSKWDGLALERVVGTTRLKGMIGGKGDTFEFV